MKIVFMGTPEIALPTLSALAKAHDVALVISQPDKPSGRGKKLHPTPVKALSDELGIPVYQPERIKSKESFELIADLSPDLIVVIAYGQIIPQRILDLPKHGIINIHGSLLPKYRGAAPIQWAIINGDKTTGVTIMQMDAGMDTGAMILKDEFEIPTGYTSLDLFKHMGEMAPAPLLTAIAQIENGTATFTVQSDTDASHAPMLEKEMGHINWDSDTATVVNLIHGLNPWPGAYTTLSTGETLKLWRAEPTTSPIDVESGVVVCADSKNGIVIKTNDGAVRITEVQVKGSKKLDAREFVKGHQLTLSTKCI